MRGSVEHRILEALGARGRSLDNVRINPLIFFDNIVERINAINFYLLNMSISIIVVELYTSRQLYRERSLSRATTRVLPRKTT